MFLTYAAVSIMMTKKAARLGFFTLHDYVRDKLTKEAEALEKLLQVTPTKKRI